MFMKIKLKKMDRGILFALAVCLMACDNPFFPPTGNLSSGYRQTPAGVIKQLFTAYENRNISLFRDLFPSTKDFRFYVSPSFVQLYQQKAYANPPDTIGGIPYYYWKFDDEIRSHEKMFRSATQISFSPRPTVNTIAQDSLTAEVHISSGGVMNITANGGEINVDVDMGEQKFLLIKDPSDPNLWVISRWFDLGVAPSSQ
jgi:hypothetical protein